MEDAIVRVKLSALPHQPTVHVYGVPHGLSEEEPLHPDVHDILKTESRDFGPKDYFLMEGFESEHLKELVPPEEADKPGNVSKDAILHCLTPILGGRKIERPECFYHWGEAKLDPTGEKARKIHGEDDPENALAEQRKLFESKTVQELMRPKGKWVEKQKAEIVEELKAAGVRPMDARRFIEFRTTFRSLLLARAAQSRAEALGSDVRLFAGFLHPGEIEEFLKKPNVVEKYLKKIQNEGPQVFQDMYARHEELNRQIAQAFRLTRANVDETQRTALLHFIAFEFQKIATLRLVGQEVQPVWPQELVRQFKQSVR